MMIAALLAGPAAAADPLSPDCRAGLKAPVETHVLAGPDRFGDFADAGGARYRHADLVPADAAGLAAPSARTVARREVAFLDLAGRPDRWGRRAGLLIDAGRGAWIGRDLVADGGALVLPALLPGPCLADLLAAEARARTGRRGLWADFAPIAAADTGAIAARAGRMAVVEGRVLSSGATRATHYLNFGRRWRTDFTVTIPAGKLVEFASAGLDAATLDGAAIRVRGIVQIDGGPVIPVAHPAQIERLDKDGMRR